MADSSNLKSKAVKQGAMSDSLTPEEYFVWSRLGEGLKVQDLLPLCPWPEADTLTRLESLISKKAASFVDSRSESTTSLHERQSIKPDLKTDISAQLDQDEKDPDLSALGRDFRMAVLLKYDSIQNAGPFEILEIHPRSTETEIKNAYLKISKLFHPDRFFTKRLGMYKRKLEIIFGKIQFAHTQLKDPIEREAILKRMNLAQDSKSKESTSSLSADQKRKLIDPEMERIGRAEHLYKQGVKQQDEKDFVAASNSFALAMQTNPTREQYKKAYENVKPLMHVQKSHDALERAQKALKVTGASPEVLKAAEEALRMDPQLAEAQYVVGRCIVELNKTDRIRDAKEMLLRAKAGLPKNADACFYLGRALQALGDDQGAKRAFEEALKRDPRHNASKKHLEKDFVNS